MKLITFGLMMAGSTWGSTHEPVNNEKVWDTTPDGTLKLTNLIKRGNGSVIYEAEMVPGLDPQSRSGRSVAHLPGQKVVVKYINDCEERMANIEPSKEYEMSQLVSDRVPGISPRTLFVSPPAWLRAVQSKLETPTQWKSHWIDRNFSTCRDRGTRIRFLVFEMVGPTLGEYLMWFSKDNDRTFRSTAFTRKVLVAFSKIFRLLWDLHNAGIVHGDIHEFNIAFRNPVKNYSEIDLANAEFVLFDFEYTKEIQASEDEVDPDAAQERKTLDPVFLSPWQIQNMRAGPRDDVYRLLLSLSEILTRFQLHKAFSNLVKINGYALSITEYMKEYTELERSVALFVRTHAPLFKHSIPLATQISVGDDKVVALETQNQIRQKLEDIHVYVLNKPPNAPIDNDFISGTLEETISLFPSNLALKRNVRKYY